MPTYKSTFRYENFIHKNRLWVELSDDEKHEYKMLRKEFVKKSAEMLREYERNGGADLEREIKQCLKEIDSARAEMESSFSKKHF